MPILTSAEALELAHRICYLRCICAAACNSSYICTFSKANLKKCAYCIKQKAKCVAVSFLPSTKSIYFNTSKIPWFCSPEFNNLLNI